MSIYSKVGEVSNIREAYMSLPHAFDIKGEVLKKDGKDLRVKTQDGTMMDILLKKDMDVKSGQTTTINRKDIENIKVVSKAQEEQEIKREDENKSKLKEIGAKDTDENRDSLNKLKEFGVEPTKDNIEKLSSLKKLLENMKGYLSMDVIAELKSKGIDVDSISLPELDKVVKEVRGAGIRDIATTISRGKLNPVISDAQAQKIAKHIYNHEMGKDILDSIKALKQMGIEPTKENVEELYDIFSKLHNIKDVEGKTLIEAMDTGAEISIDLLYRLKNYVKISSLPIAGSSGYQYPDKPLTSKEIEALDGEIDKLLQEMGLSKEYKSIAKDILLSGGDITAESLENVKVLRETLSGIQHLMDKNTASVMIDSGIDILNYDLKSLLELVQEINQEGTLMQTALMTKTEEDNAKLLLGLIKQISPTKLLSENQTLAALMKNKGKEQLEELLFGEQKKEISLLSKQELTLLRTSAILQGVKDISSLRVMDSRQEISLMHLAQKSGFLTKDWAIDSKFTDIKPNIKPEVLQRQEKDSSSIIAHYQSLRSTLRAGHVRWMMQEGIDPLRTDIRTMKTYVENYERIYSRYAIQDLTSFETDKISVDMLKSNEIWSMKTLAKNIDIAQSKSRLTEGIQKLYDEAEAREFKEVKEQMRSAIQHLSNTDKNTKQDYEQHLTYMYQRLKESEELIKNSKREDREVFQRGMKDIEESIRDFAKGNKTDSMIQIPLFMNNESSNANIFAKSNKKNNREIDPEDMSVLIDLNMKTLGKVGFYLKVENKDIAINISARESSAEAIKEQMQSLSNFLALAGYQLKQVNISSEESAAKIAFTEDKAPYSMQSGLDVRI